MVICVKLDRVSRVLVSLSSLPLILFAIEIIAIKIIIIQANDLTSNE